MNTCKTCVYWDKEYHEHGKGRCMHTKMDGSTTESADSVCCWADSLNSMQTGPDFGCIHHSPSEE